MPKALDGAEKVLLAEGAQDRRNQNDAQHGAPEAIVYIGPLSLGVWSDGKSVNGLVTRLCAACDTQARTGSSRWSIDWRDGAVATSRGASDPKTHHVATIIRQDGPEESQEFDVYEYAWVSHVKESWEERSVVARVALILLALLRARGFLSYFNKAPRRAEKGRLQLTLAAMAILTVVAYLAIVVWAFVDSIIQLPEIVGGDTASQGRTQEISFPQWLTVVLTALGLAGFSRIKAHVSAVGAALVASNHYLRAGYQRGRLMRGLLDLAEQLRENEQYRSVTIIGYSFGSILAIDAIFPKAHVPERAFEKVRRLVTIGSAYDFVLAAEPNYLKERRATVGVPERWINVYAPIDLLGSDFKEDPSEHGPPDVPVAEIPNGPAGKRVVSPDESIEYDNGTHVDLANALALYGFFAHDAYWGPDDTPDRNVFNLIVPVVYPEDDGPLR